MLLRVRPASEKPILGCECAPHRRDKGVKHLNQVDEGSSGGPDQKKQIPHCVCRQSLEECGFILTEGTAILWVYELHRELLRTCCLLVSTAEKLFHYAPPLLLPVLSYLLGSFFVSPFCFPLAFIFLTPAVSLHSSCESPGLYQ